MSCLQANTTIYIPKEHHRWILGKSGTRLKELEKETATRIQVPSIGDNSDKIVIQGTKDSIDKAVHEIMVINDEQVNLYIFNCYLNSINIQVF